jgi:hypothetical protein
MLVPVPTSGRRHAGCSRQQLSGRADLIRFYADFYGHVYNDLIDRERNAVNLDDQYDSKGQMPLISFQTEFPKDHDTSLARNVLNQLPEFPALVVLSYEIWNILDKKICANSCVIA